MTDCFALLTPPIKRKKKLSLILPQGYILTHVTDFHQLESKGKYSPEIFQIGQQYAADIAGSHGDKWHVDKMNANYPRSSTSSLNK